MPFAALPELADPIVDPRSPKAPESHEEGKQYSELLKLDIRVAKWTVQRYMRDARPPRDAGQR